MLGGPKEWGQPWEGSLGGRGAGAGLWGGRELGWGGRKLRGGLSHRWGLCGGGSLTSCRQQGQKQAAQRRGRHSSRQGRPARSASSRWRERRVPQHSRAHKWLFSMAWKSGRPSPDCTVYRFRVSNPNRAGGRGQRTAVTIRMMPSGNSHICLGHQWQQIWLPLWPLATVMVTWVTIDNSNGCFSH